MDDRRLRELQEKAARGKYMRLFVALRDRKREAWRTSFGEVETLLGFNLPGSAMTHRPWWANDATHSHAIAWLAAGWKTVDVDMTSQTLTFVLDDARCDVV